MRENENISAILKYDTYMIILNQYHAKNDDVIYFFFSRAVAKVWCVIIFLKFLMKSTAELEENRFSTYTSLWGLFMKQNKYNSVQNMCMIKYFKT